MNLGEYIAKIIDEQGKTKVWVAEKSGIIYKTFVDKLTRDSFTGKELLRVAMVLNINLEDLKDVEKWENMKSYCLNCDTDVEFNIKEVIVKNEIKGIFFDCLAKIPYCRECGEEIYISELSDNNVKIAHKKYRELKGEI